MLTRVLGRVAAVALAVTAAVVVAAPAYAHTQATIDNPQAGATNVTLTLTAEAESSSAGIKGIEVVLPGGITPTQVSLVSGPPRWAFAATAKGFTVAGASLPVGTDAKTSLRIAALPATATVLVFKTLVNYSNGKVDRWIEEPTADNPDPADPAPVVRLKPAAATSSPAASSAAAVVASSNPADVQTAPTSGASSSSWPLIIAAVVVLIAVIAAVVIWRRRSGAPPIDD